MDIEAALSPVATAQAAPVSADANADPNKPLLAPRVPAPWVPAPWVAAPWVAAPWVAAAVVSL